MTIVCNSPVSTIDQRAYRATIRKADGGKSFGNIFIVRGI